jgi:gluconolactonase
VPIFSVMLFAEEKGVRCDAIKIIWCRTLFTLFFWRLCFSGPIFLRHYLYFLAIFIRVNSHFEFHFFLNLQEGGHILNNRFNVSAGIVFFTWVLCVGQTVSLPESICVSGTQAVKVSGSLNLNNTEGPAVNAAGDLFFTEPGSSKIWKIPANGVIPSAPFLANSEGANGLTIDAHDNLVAAQQNKVTRFKPDGSVAEILAQTNGTVTLGSVNDLTMGTHDQMYFTNWDGGKVFYRDPNTGTTRVVATGYKHSNGVFLIEEDSILFVNEDDPGIIYKYKVAADGSISNRVEFQKAKITDGLRIDTLGNVYCAAYGDKRIEVFNSSGVALGKIDLSAVAANVTNCAFGGTDDKTLYITASSGVYKVQLKIPGRRLGKLTSLIRNSGNAPVFSKNAACGSIKLYSLNGKFLSPVKAHDEIHRMQLGGGAYVLDYSNGTHDKLVLIPGRK